MRGAERGHAALGAHAGACGVGVSAITREQIAGWVWEHVSAATAATRRALQVRQAQPALLRNRWRRPRSRTRQDRDALGAIQQLGKALEGLCARHREQLRRQLRRAERAAARTGALARATRDGPVKRSGARCWGRGRAPATGGRLPALLGVLRCLAGLSRGLYEAGCSADHAGSPLRPRPRAAAARGTMA